jgi:putative hydrolase of the HAD superfamily
VLFDAAGTLIELVEPVGESYARLARQHGVALPAWRLEDAFGRVLRGAPPMAFPGAAAGAVADLERAWWRGVVRATFLATDATARFADFEAFFAELFDHFARAASWRARPGSAAALAGLRARGLATGVVSNFDHRLPAILVGLGLAAQLDCVVLPGEVGVAKPDPAIFAHALSRLRVRADETLFVGDREDQDLAGARAAGLRAIDAGGLATLTQLLEQLFGGNA